MSRSNCLTVPTDEGIGHKKKRAELHPNYESGPLGVQSLFPLASTLALSTTSLSRGVRP